MSAEAKSRPAHAGHVCPAWLGLMLDNPLRSLLHDPVRLLGAYVRAGQRVADIGAGPGFFTLPLCRLVGATGRVYAIYVQPAMLRQLERKAQRAGITNLVARQPDPAGLPISEPLDFVLLFWMLHEVDDPAQLLRQLRLVLREGALVMFVEPRGHVSPATYDAELALFASAGFRVREPLTVRLSRGMLLEKA